MASVKEEYIRRVRVYSQGEDYVILVICVSDLYWLDPLWQELKETHNVVAWFDDGNSPSRPRDSYLMQSYWHKSEKFSYLLMTKKKEKAPIVKQRRTKGCQLP